MYLGGAIVVGYVPMTTSSTFSVTLPAAGEYLIDGLSLHDAKLHVCPMSGASHCAFFEPGYSSQNPASELPLTLLRTPLPLAGR
jgi:hypothetical protein